MTEHQSTDIDTCRSWRNRADLVLAGRILPVGFFAFLTGMFWIGDHGYYSKLFYWIVMLPVLLHMAIQPNVIKLVFGSRIVLAFVAFASYVSVTLCWTTANEGILAPIKRPLFVFLLFCAVFGIGYRRPGLLCKTVKASAIAAVLAALVTLVRFYGAGAYGRLAGYGALFNPLLVSHVFGFFAALWLGYYFAKPKLLEPGSLWAIFVCVILLFSTGSRTPLVAIAATTVWLAALSANRKSALVLGTLVIGGISVGLLAPDLLLQRGLSYRTEIWTNVLEQISEAIWKGHGYGAPLRIQLIDIPYPFSDPHNLTLAVFYAGGIVGLALWLLLYFLALQQSWRKREDPWVLVCSATVVYGFAAGMTEGGSFLSRPKEHWFLIWIPMALLAEATCRNRSLKNEAK